ncbi:hypothetical protein PGT21_033351 [Puccinia graminis f. sp. tritici]|uniref:Uncharacterized protein n=1 Tax=Puccinia graminis f. sp. tritici TaxID=56615 RepID=A0A5B0R6V6_PUCGR|nr:hypothetical protein PGT21_031516 [Puccinia graminis f. sp. tritici]KAA1118200.1 hypothetical protein PGT21_033351 [Puccinia graminis f. sp. tritici]KAA1120633.1 hypothetical protein PGTUg99_014341 [Puccinia graminis f. sp. tritici]KAA1121252.1 hypothetical protein PGTUg99_028663 [Puccinia graminis f. sp. tritici]
MMCFIGFIVLAALGLFIETSAILHKIDCQAPAIIWNVHIPTRIAKLTCTSCDATSQEYRVGICLNPKCRQQSPIPSYKTRTCHNTNCMKEIEHGWNILICNHCSETHPGYWLAKRKCPHCNIDPPYGLAYDPDIIPFP